MFERDKVSGSNDVTGESRMPVKPVSTTLWGRLPVTVYRNLQAMSTAAAEEAGDILRAALRQDAEVNVILATGDSQLAFLAVLRSLSGIDWSRVNIFHMDDYVNLDPAHPASFPLFLHRNIVDTVKPKAFYPVPGQAPDLLQACRDYEALLRAHPASLCALGIGENGHLAFNDPPFADFEDPVWVKVVRLDTVSRLQQVREGHFPNLDAVPTHAITLTIPALLSARRLICLAPQARKIGAVHHTLFDPIGPSCPATILRRTPYAHLYLDADSARGAAPA
jgi:glucosamine-6-phosphate deaminase